MTLICEIQLNFSGSQTSTETVSVCCQTALTMADISAILNPDQADDLNCDDNDNLVDRQLSTSDTEYDPDEEEMDYDSSDSDCSER